MEVRFEKSDLCFSGGDEFIQKAIRFFTQSKFSHSFVIMEGPGQRLCALETTSTLVTLTPANRKYLEKYYVEVWRPVGDNLKETISILSQNAFIRYSGNWYGHISYVWFIYRWFMSLFGRDLKKMWRWANRGITCTELTNTSFPFIIDNERDPNTITPQIMRDWIARHPEYFTLVGYINQDKMPKK
jgi:hypothetical protein